MHAPPWTVRAEVAGAASTVVRYDCAAAGGLLHIDTKKLVRIDGVGHRITVHLAVDDHSRVSIAQVLSDEKIVSCVQFLRAAVGYYACLGVRIERVITENGTGYKNTFRAACDELGIQHTKTRPYTPKTNGKAERFVQTSLREWATRGPTSAMPNARPPCSPSCIDTTGIGHTQHSIDFRP
jgi:transposase InsO family protein